MFQRHAGTVTAHPGGHPAEEPRGGWADPSVPTHACCCPARPKYKVVMPPAGARRHPVDLWLCGHHYHVSQAALATAGARVYPLDRPGLPAGTPAGPRPAA